ncbi:MAG: hypothetical protein ACFFAU_02285 [Candidatus Hodarchaeota archaeon]
MKQIAERNYLPQTELFFTHGIEIENHLVSRETGEVLVGNELLNVWEEMFQGAAEYLNRIKKDKKTPKIIANKIVKIEVKEEEKREKRLSFVFVHYKLGKKTIKVNSFGPDPNISQITWLLELVTPPCEFLEELAFWIDTLYDAALYGLSKKDVALLPMGLNPMEKRVRSGLTCGEHHHIGIPSFFRAPVYNLIRNFIPHLIAFSSTSPFLDQSPSAKVIIKENNGKKQIIGRCIHSYRLLNNTGQMGPNIPQYLPPIDDLMDGEDFSRLVKKAPPDHRMVDMFPYTDYSTIELRFFDAQPWFENRLAIVLLIQAIAQKAKNLVGEKKEIHNVSAQILFENRRKAIQFGFLAQFTPDNDLHPDFARYYNYDSLTGKKASKLMHSANSLIYFVQNELETLGTDFLDYLLIPLLGNKKFFPPLSVAEFLLSLYQSSKDFSKNLNNLYYTKKLKYPLTLDDETLLEFVDVEAIEIEKKETKLQHTLRNDLTKRQLVVIETPQKKRKKKAVEVPVKALPTKPKPIEIKEIRRKPLKTKKPVPSKKPVPKKVIVLDEEIITPKIPLKQETPMVDKITKPTVISTFEETEDLEVFAPAIEIEPKYRKIESKIANVMKTKRKEIEARRQIFFREHLAEERKPFRFTKKVAALFPPVVSGNEIFGYIEISFSKIRKTLYKFCNNPITFIFTAQNSGEYVTKVNTSIDIAMLERKKVNKIPFSINLGELFGEITVKVEAITATNESLLPDNFSFKFERKDEITIETKEFYITGNYGPVECVYRAINEYKKAEKGELDVFLVSQSLTEPISIYRTKFNINPKEYLELARSIDLDVNYQHSPFYIVACVTTGRFSKNRAFKTIRVPQLDEILVDWNFVVDPSKRPNLWHGVIPNAKFEIDFVFQFIRPLPPLIIEIFVNCFPTGEKKKLSELKIKRQIDEGDEVAAENIKFKTPKNCEYLFFDVEIRTEKGLIPLEVISEPIGVHGIEQQTTYEERLDLTL